MSRKILVTSALPYANGAIHPRGAHNQMTYVIDGVPFSDQLTGAFANALDAFAKTP